MFLLSKVFFEAKCASANIKCLVAAHSKPGFFWETFSAFNLWILTIRTLFSSLWSWAEFGCNSDHSWIILLKVSKSQKQNCHPKLIPKMNRRICFSILTVRNYLKLEIETSSFMYFRTLRIEKQICLFFLWRSFGTTILLLRFTDL